MASLDYAHVADFHRAQLHFITFRERSKCLRPQLFFFI